jgi:hypothetical protein
MVLLLAIVLFTGLHWLHLILGLQALSALPYWCFRPREQAIHWPWIALAASALLLACAIAIARVHAGMKISVLVLLGSAIQFSCAYSKGQGLDGLRDRMVSTGHAEFARIAVQEKSIVSVTRDYEALAQRGNLGKYAPSKPPGTLLLYMITDRLANMSPAATSAERLNSLRTLASLTWPLISYLVLIPIFLLTSTIIPAGKAGVASLLYVTVPSVTLITLHTDGVFFPLLAIMPVWLAAVACARHSAPLAVAAGVALYLAVFCSFGVACVAAMMMAVALALLWQDPAADWRLALQLLSAIVVGAALSDVLARVFLHYDILTRFVTASDYHAKWQGWDGSQDMAIGAALTTTVEFSVFLGMPLTILLIAAVGNSLSETVTTRTLRVQSALTLSIPAIVLFLVVFSRTRDETARLWMFLIPFVCVAVSCFINNLVSSFRRRWQWGFILSVVALQFGTTYLTLRHQDFH